MSPTRATTTRFDARRCRALIVLSAPLRRLRGLLGLDRHEVLGLHGEHGAYGVAGQHDVELDHPFAGPPVTGLNCLVHDARAGSTFAVADLVLHARRV